MTWHSRVRVHDYVSRRMTWQVGSALAFWVRYLDCTPSAANGFDCNPFFSQPLNVSGSA